jgi:prophage regulatory protein
VPTIEERSVTERILPIAETAKIAGLSRRTVYREVKAERFPKPVQLSIRRVGWRESEVDAWIKARRSA